MKPDEAAADSLCGRVRAVCRLTPPSRLAIKQYSSPNGLRFSVLQNKVEGQLREE